MSAFHRTRLPFQSAGGFLCNARFESCITLGLELCKNDKNARPRNARF